MYGACNQLFACSCFTSDKDRRITWRNFGNAGKYSFQNGRGSNDLFKHRGLGDFFTQSDVLLLQSLLSSFAFINIRSRNIPAHNLSLFVAHWVKASQEPAITPIRYLHPQFQLVSGATGTSTIGISQRRPFSVIRMNEPTGAKKTSGCLSPLFKTEADVIERNAVSIKTFATRSEYSDKLRRKIQHLLELHFTSAQFLLCSFTLSDVADRPDKLA